jgi:hypothetical protein
MLEDDQRSRDKVGVIVIATTDCSPGSIASDSELHMVI